MMTSMKDICIHAFMVCGAALTLTSCIRDDLQPCPPLTLNIGVLDKNYSNAADLVFDDGVDIDERVSEDEPFAYYVPTLYYRLSRLNGDGSLAMVKERGVFTVEDDEKTVGVDFGNELPFGKYVFTVWGGIPDLSEFNADRTELSFHPDHAQGYDVYMTSDTICYDATHSSFESMLKRTKGKLIIYAEDVPRRIQFYGKNVDQLYGSVDTRFCYGDKTSVTTHQERRGVGGILTETFLTPSIKEDGSEVDVNFYDDYNLSHPDISPDDVDITMRRNELTVLKYVYDKTDNVFHIYILINDNWEKMHNMNIE